MKDRYKRMQISGSPPSDNRSLSGPYTRTPQNASKEYSAEMGGVNENDGMSEIYGTTDRQYDSGSPHSDKRYLSVPYSPTPQNQNTENSKQMSSNDNNNRNKDNNYATDRTHSSGSPQRDNRSLSGPYARTPRNASRRNNRSGSERNRNICRRSEDDRIYRTHNSGSPHRDNRSLSGPYSWTPRNASRRNNRSGSERNRDIGARSRNDMMDRKYSSGSPLRDNRSLSGSCSQTPRNASRSNDGIERVHNRDIGARSNDEVMDRTYSSGSLHRDNRSLSGPCSQTPRNASRSNDGIERDVNRDDTIKGMD